MAKVERAGRSADSYLEIADGNGWTIGGGLKQVRGREEALLGDANSAARNSESFMSMLLLQTGEKSQFTFGNGGDFDPEIGHRACGMT